MTDPLFQLLELDDLVSVVDIGANPIDDEPPYKEMLRNGLCRVTGFEPQPEALHTLLQQAGEREVYLPYAVGDGSKKVLNVCQSSGMTSILKPSTRMLSLFNEFSILGSVTGVEEISTNQLDDISEVDRIDFLKIDVQGAELEVFKSGTKKLQDAVAIQTEVSFIPLYENQPVFGEVDIYLRSIGFIPHAMPACKQWPLYPMVFGDNLRQPLNQLLEADIVYVRDFSQPDTMTYDQWKKLALIAHHCFRSYDLAFRCVRVCEEAGELKLGSWEKYIGIINTVSNNRLK